MEPKAVESTASMEGEVSKEAENTETIAAESAETAPTEGELPLSDEAAPTEAEPEAEQS